jgi:hypothetical protein
MRGTVGRNSKFTVGQVRQMADIQLNEAVQSLQKKQHMIDLQR